MIEKIWKIIVAIATSKTTDTGPGGRVPVECPHCGKEVRNFKYLW